MTRSFTAKLGVYAGLASFGLLAALALGIPELVALAAPLALAAAFDLALTEQPRLGASFELERLTALEGERVGAVVRLTSPAPIERLELLIDAPPGLSIVDGDNPVALRLGPRDGRELARTIRCDRWGGYALGRLHLRATSRFGLVRHELELEPSVDLKVYPTADAVSRLVRPRETQVFSGNQVARQKGEGIEFADLRAFVPGDRIRRINWRASARRGELWVNELHAERNADVIVFLDSFTEARGGTSGTLDLAVRAAAVISDAYLREKDRVGLISFGGVLNWLLPGSGLTQLYRIVDSLLDTEIILNYAWKDIDVLPRRTLPPQALVLALTPFLDERSSTALLDLVGRGFDLAIVEISPLPFSGPGAGDDEQLAHRIWRLRRDALRGRFEHAGVPVAVWEDGAPISVPLEEVRAFRRFAARGRG